MSALPDITPYVVGLRFLGMTETPGVVHSPAIVAMLQLTDRSVRDDETPWCSAYVNYVCWLLGLPRSNSLAARSWLHVGMAIPIAEARRGFDIVVLMRGPNAAPATVLQAPGHVGFFDAWDANRRTVRILGGNQGNAVTLQDFPIARVLGVRRLA